jgi:NAD-dependent SIR2 family protein deacetylase
MRDGALDELHAFARRHRRLFVLTGAGVSTDSGIPAYRDDAGRWSRTAPVIAQEFLRSAQARRRYWARSMAGWPTVAHARPNAAHDALARLDAAGRIAVLVTQNVDGLHQRAGSLQVLELHGSLHRVTCLACRAGYARAVVQEMLEQGNPERVRGRPGMAPDGDADLAAADCGGFNVPACPRCGGMLKPDIVLFGENVPRERVDAAMRALDGADAMLVVGSSLTVYSGFRFCERAVAVHKPIAAVNRGRTRADALYTLKVEGSCAEVLGWLAAQLGAA